MFIETPASKQSLSGRKLLYGVGINDAEYNVRIWKDYKEIGRCHYYSVWTDILTRCYSDKFHKRQATYKGCFMCDEWLTFTNFKEWMMRQSWEDKSIDKDIIKQGNKEYCPEFCSFVPRQINTLIISANNENRSLPSGVCYYRRDDNYKAQLNKFGKNMHLGYFDNPREAGLVYVKAKLQHIKEVAISYYYSGRISRRVFDGLIAWEIK